MSYTYIYVSKLIPILRIHLFTEETDEGEGRKKPTSTRTNASTVWNYFVKNKEKQSASCIICNRVTPRKDGCTTALWSHLKSQHKITKDTLIMKTT